MARFVDHLAGGGWRLLRSSNVAVELYGCVPFMVSTISRHRAHAPRPGVDRSGRVGRSNSVHSRRPSFPHPRWRRRPATWRSPARALGERCLGSTQDRKRGSSSGIASRKGEG